MGDARFNTALQSRQQGSVEGEGGKWVTRRLGKAGPAARASMTAPASMASRGSAMWRAHSWMTQGEMWASHPAAFSLSCWITAARLSSTRCRVSSPDPCSNPPSPAHHNPHSQQVWAGTSLIFLLLRMLPTSCLSPRESLSHLPLKHLVKLASTHNKQHQQQQAVTLRQKCDKICKLARLQ